MAYWDTIVIVLLKQVCDPLNVLDLYKKVRRRISWLGKGFFISINCWEFYSHVDLSRDTVFRMGERFEFAFALADGRKACGGCSGRYRHGGWKCERTIKISRFLLQYKKFFLVTFPTRNWRHSTGAWRTCHEFWIRIVLPFFYHFFFFASSTSRV